LRPLDTVRTEDAVVPCAVASRHADVQTSAMVGDRRPDAIVIPLGRQATSAVDLAGVDPQRVLYGFPHPSGANGHRLAQHRANQDQLADAARAWFG